MWTVYLSAVVFLKTLAATLNNELSGLFMATDRPSPLSFLDRFLRKLKGAVVVYSSNSFQFKLPVRNLFRPLSLIASRALETKVFGKGFKNV